MAQPVSKSLFDADELYTNAAIELDREATTYIRGVFDRLAADGYNIRDISTVLQGVVWCETGLAEMSRTMRQQRLKATQR